MSEPLLMQLTGVNFEGPSGEDIVTTLLESQATDAAVAAISGESGFTMRDPDSISQHPISQGLAHELCERTVGIGGLRTYHRWTGVLPIWWARLRSAPTPEERLTCERMINALNRAAGMHMTERGAKLIARNRQRWDQEQADEAAAKEAAEEAAAIDRWR